MASVLKDDDLLAAVKSRPALYDKSNKNHCNRELTRSLWREIARETGAEEVTCKTRWNSMRDYFLRKYREGTRPGQPVSGKKVWPYFDQLTFLMPHVTSREPLDSMDGFEGEEMFVNKIEMPSRSPSPDDLEPNQTVAETPKVRLSLAPPKNPKKRKGEFGSDQKSLKALKRKESGHEHFFRSILPMLESFSDIETLQFRSEVHGLVLKYLHKQSVVPVLAAPAGEPMPVEDDETGTYSVYIDTHHSPQ